MSAEVAARAVLAALPIIPSGRCVVAQLLDVRMTFADGTGVVTGVSSVVVALDSGRAICEPLASFTAEVLADLTVTWAGRRVLLVTTEGDAIVIGSLPLSSTQPEGV